MSKRYIAIDTVIEILKQRQLYSEELGNIIRANSYRANRHIVRCEKCAYAGEIPQKNIYGEELTAEEMKHLAPSQTHSGVFLCSLTGRKRGGNFYCFDGITEDEIKNRESEQDKVLDAIHRFMK